MTDLVTEAAIEAALKAWHGGLEHYRDEVKARLDLVAPRIAAQALREAREEIDKRYPATKETGWVPIAMAALDDLADEIEANAAFTEMVQLGQDLEGNN